jgi:hypothetical protein
MSSFGLDVPASAGQHLQHQQQHHQPLPQFSGDRFTRLPSSPLLSTSGSPADVAGAGGSFMEQVGRKFGFGGFLGADDITLGSSTLKSFLS